MTDFNIRSDSVNVEQIMVQIRARIREKRGVDYTEEEIRELANVKLEKFLDPKKVRSDLVEHYRRQRPKQLPTLPPLPDPPPFLNYSFEDHTIYYSSRGPIGTAIGLMRKLFSPVLKLLFNPNPIIHVLHMQSEINTRNKDQFAEFREQFKRVEEMLAVRDEVRVPLDDLNYELLNNLVVEITRLGIEVKNLKMRVESLSSRLDFDERRGRALEGVVQYKPGAVPPSQLTGGPAVSGEPGGQPQTATQPQGDTRRTRRRRRRGRRRGAAAEPGAVNAAPTSDMTATSVEPEPAPDAEPEGGATPEQ